MSKEAFVCVCVAAHSMGVAPTNKCKPRPVPSRAGCQQGASWSSNVAERVVYYAWMFFFFSKATGECYLTHTCRCTGSADKQVICGSASNIRSRGGGRRWKELQWFLLFKQHHKIRNPYHASHCLKLNPPESTSDLRRLGSRIQSDWRLQLHIWSFSKL